MDFHEYLVYYGLICFTLWAVYKFFKDQELEMRRLRERNSTLARWLQLAELQTVLRITAQLRMRRYPMRGTLSSSGHFKSESKTQV